jgi:hypothetical protein
MMLTVSSVVSACSFGARCWGEIASFSVRCYSEFFYGPRVQDMAGLDFD